MEWVDNRKKAAYARDPDFILPLEQMEYFLSLDAVNDECLDFALVWHAARGCIDICKALLDAGADIGCTVEALNNSSPLRSATVHGEEVARYLLTRGASIHTPGIVKTAGLYGHISLVKLLVLSGADCESEFDSESTADAIRARCDSPNRDAILHFLEHEAKELTHQRVQTLELENCDGSDADNSLDSSASTSLLCAKSGGQEEVIKVMMSYCWDNQEVIKTITAKLRACSSCTFQVWLDIDHMCGSTLDAMARAVEEADVFLMGVSAGYKSSANCRLEAEYAAIKRKILIPLMLQKDYR
jgi:ankyrin repeat protein